MEFDFKKEPGRQLLDRGLDSSGTPLVSLITPYYNAGQYFEQTFRSVMNQTFPWFEWIVADDGSTDEESLRILDHLASLDSRIRVFHKENGGVSSARNLAIREARTDIVIPLDADDLIVPTYVEVLFWALLRNPEYDWAYSNSVGFQNQEYLWNKPFDAARLKTDNYLTNCAAIRRGVLEAVGQYSEAPGYYHEDWHLWLKLLSAHRKPVKTSFWGFWYRRSDTGALSIANSDPKYHAMSNRMIREAAEMADTSIRAKEYPCSAAPGIYAAPRRSDWERKVFREHKKIHVMLLLPWMEMGGADLFNLDVCRMIDRERFELSILTTVPAEQSWRQRFEDYVTDIFDLPGFLNPEDYPEFISYFIRSREIDVLFLSNSYFGYYLLPWLRKEFPHLAIIDYVHMEEWYWRAGGYARTSGVMGDFLESTYVCNERTRQVMIRDFGRSPESVETLYIGVDQEKYDPEKVESGKARTLLGLRDDRPMILFPCRIHPQKRPFLMLEIAKETKKRIPKIAFAVVGDGPQLEELRIAIRREGLEETVYLAGRQEDMLPWYRDSAMTLICSLKEGLALTAYESLSMGKPVITSDVGGQKELIDETVGAVLPLMQDEETELDKREFLPEEIGQYAEAIEKLLADGRAYASICRACRQRIESRFSSQLMIRRLEQILEELTASPSAADRRAEISRKLDGSRKLTEELLTLASEVEGYELVYKNAYAQDTKNELMRIANSKWGRRMIQLAFRLKLNKLF